MTPEARQQAIATVRAQQSLTGIPPAEWSYAQRTRYNQALAEYILNYPGRFSAQDLSTASVIYQRGYSPLEDTSFDWAMFAEETAANAAPVFAGFQLTLNKVLAGLVVFLALAWVIKSKPARA